MSASQAGRVHVFRPEDGGEDHYAIEIGRPAPGDTVYVSSAAGAVGQLAGQFARRAGARVVGSAGSAAKVDFVLQRCGFGLQARQKGRTLMLAVEPREEQQLHYT
jgi:NADPH:quinone reductase-like Zn-dependent oxidoreductase